jgi:hypothetical protein
LKIKVIKTTQEVQEKGKAKWTKLNVVFHNEATGKVDGRNVLSFTNKDVYAALSAAQRDDVFEVTEITNAKGYPEVVKVEKLAPESMASPTVTDVQVAAAKTTTAPRSNFETPEERAARQEYIVRQSSLSNAVAVLSVGAKSPPSLEDVTNLADKFVGYVFKRDVVPAKNEVQSIADMENDIPY